MYSKSIGKRNLTIINLQKMLLIYSYFIIIFIFIIITYFYYVLVNIKNIKKKMNFLLHKDLATLQWQYTVKNF
jgi:hypothetical protein